MIENATFIELCLGSLNHELSDVLRQASSDAERGDFFRVYSILNENVKYFNDTESEKARILGEKGVQDSLRLARIDAERGIVKRMNTYLELAEKYTSLFGLKPIEELGEIRTIGNSNKPVYTPTKTRCKCGITRHAGYADL